MNIRRQYAWLVNAAGSYIHITPLSSDWTTRHNQNILEGLAWLGMALNLDDDSVHFSDANGEVDSSRFSHILVQLDGEE